jgi:hypothetical protein
MMWINGKDVRREDGRRSTSTVMDKKTLSFWSHPVYDFLVYETLDQLFS